MLTKPLAQALNEQIASEFSASNHYLAIATYFAQRSLDEWAAFFFRQSDEERMHGMKILTYLIDNAAEVTLPAVAEVHTDFADALTAVNSALESERHVTEQFNHMAALANEHKDHRGLQFLQWFINEQVEEEATMAKLVDLLKSGINLFQAQQYLPAVQAGSAAASVPA